MDAASTLGWESKRSRTLSRSIVPLISPSHLHSKTMTGRSLELLSVVTSKMFILPGRILRFSIRISASCQLISTHGTTIPSNISQSKLHSLYCMDDIRRTGPSSNRKACLSAQGVTPSSSVSVASADSWKGCPRSVLVQMVWSLRFHPFSIRKPQLNGFVVECRNPRRYRSVILDGLP
jgi:hypothetical protein